MGSVFKQQYKRRNGQKGVSKNYYGRVVDEHGDAKRVPLSTDKQAAKAMLVDLERQVELRKAGFID